MNIPIISLYNGIILLINIDNENLILRCERRYSSILTNVVEKGDCTQQYSSLATSTHYLNHQE